MTDEMAPTIVVVDDKLPVRNAVRYHLERAGYHVIEAASGREALRYLNDNPADLILLDVMMPEMDGFTTAKRIRQIPFHVKTPIVMVSAKNQVADVLAAVEAGANDYLLKPFTRDGLLKKVRRYIAQPVENLSETKMVRRLTEEVEKQGGKVGTAGGGEEE